MFYQLTGRGTVADVIKTCGEAANIQTLILHFDQFRYLRRILRDQVGAHMEVLTHLMLEGCAYVRDTLQKAVMVVVSLDPFLHDEEDRNANLSLKERLMTARFPVFPTLEGAIRASVNLCRYGVEPRNVEHRP